ncbi:MAG: esterase/lipase family protein [Candidatus Hodarchaeales archaeon]|jgi:pimeloyl-ACP methyl ester carboxylesterase
MAKKYPHPRFIDVTPETEKLKELDHFWIQMDHCKHLKLWRFSYLSDDETGEFIPTREGRFYEPILLIHGYGSSHTIFNWFARELWYYGFRKLFAIDNEHAELLVAGDRLAQIIDEIKQITNAYRISMITHSTGGIIARYYAKFTAGADSHIRILAMCGVPHDSAQYLRSLKGTQNQMNGSQVRKALDYLEDINSTITEKELYYLTQVNLGGVLWSNSEGAIKFVPLSDAINISIGQTHMRVHKHKAIFGTLRNLLIPSVAVFKVRLLTLSNITAPLGIRIYYKGRTTQKYPQSGWIQIPKTLKGPYLPEAPVIIFSNSISLDQYKEVQLVINLFEKQRFKQKSIGKVECTLDCEELPRVEYITIHGKSNERVDFAIYTYIP